MTGVGTSEEGGKTELMLKIAAFKYSTFQTPPDEPHIRIPTDPLCYHSHLSHCSFPPPHLPGTVQCQRSAIAVLLVLVLQPHHLILFPSANHKSGSITLALVTRFLGSAFSVSYNLPNGDLRGICRHKGKIEHRTDCQCAVPDANAC